VAAIFTAVGLVEDRRTLVMVAVWVPEPALLVLIAVPSLVREILNAPVV
jgi:hypothetical protein